MSEGASEAKERRRQQAELYGASVDAIARDVEQHVGIDVREMASVIGVSWPMFNEVLAARRVRIGNPAGIVRLGMLRDFAGHLASGEADPADIDLTLAQIRSATDSGPRNLTAVADGPPRSGVGLLTKQSLTAARALVGRHVRPTPARRWPLLERITGTETWLKHENHNPTGAFKVRGGLNFVARLGQTNPDLAGIISATTGNHGQSLAYAGRAHRLPVTIVVPEGNSPDKNDSMRGYGADLIVHGRDFQAALEYSLQLAAEKQLLPVPPFHPWLVEGVATYAAELHESVPAIDVLYVPVGMGSGICANIAVRDLMGLATEIVGVVAEQAPAYALSFEAGEPVASPTSDTFVDGVAVRTPDPDAVRIIRAGAARIVQVSEDQAAEAMALHYRATHNLAEPAGSLALAGMLTEKDRVAGRRVALIQTGGNCDFPVLARAMAKYAD